MIEAASIESLRVVDFQIVESHEVITEEWPHRGDVEPALDQNAEGVFVLTVHNQGEHGKFEVPYIGSFVVHADDELAVILTGYHGTEPSGPKKHRHTARGQFYRFYQRIDEGTWQRVEWRRLDEKTREIALGAWKSNAPEWARCPGKLTAEYAKPTRRVKTTTYKIVRVIDERYYSVFDSRVEWIIGECRTEPARPKHRGGFFSYPDQARLLELFEKQRLFPLRCYREPITLALLECEISGKIIGYDNGKVASTHLRPLTVLSTFEYCPQESVMG